MEISPAVAHASAQSRPIGVPTGRRRITGAAAALTALTALALTLALPAAAQQTRYSYDDAGRLIRVDYPGGGHIRYEYDANGNLLEKITVPPAPPTPEIAVLLDDQELHDGQPAAVSFGTSIVGSAGARRVFTVRNDGGLELSGLAVSLPPGFALVEALAPALGPGASDTFTVSLETREPGDRSGDASIASNDADESQFIFQVTGTVPPAAPRRFDFGTDGSPVAAGYTRVTPATAYLPGAGFGWTSGTVDARDRAKGSDLARDFNFTTLGTFVVDLPSGVYDVVVTVGDASGAHDQMGISLESSPVDTVTTAVNEIVTRTYRVTVTGDRLTIGLDDLGGSDDYAVINALVAHWRRGPSRRLPGGG
jgi:YD repeat-containing protein